MGHGKAEKSIVILFLSRSKTAKILFLFILLSSYDGVRKEKKKHGK